MKVSDWGSAQALRHALNTLPITGREEDKQARSILLMMLEQRGCQDNDPACDGSLTSLIDIIVFG